MEKIRKLLPYNQNFGPQPNDEKQFFAKAQIGDIFVFSPAFDFKVVQKIASDNGFRIEYCENGTEEHRKYGPNTCKIIAKNIIISPIYHTIKTDYSFSYSEYGPFVYVSICANEKDSIIIDGLDPSNQKKSYAWNVCVSRNDFDEMIEKYGSDARWLIEKRFTEKEDIFFVPIVQQRMSMYIDGRESEYRGKERPDDILTLLETGKYHLVVRDLVSCDSFFYGVDGNPVYRKFRMQYKNTGLHSNNYDIGKMAIFLRSCESVTDVTVINSAVIYGDSAVDFTYTPTQDFFLELASMDEHNRTKTIMKKIGVINE